MNYKLIKELINELEQQDKRFDKPKSQHEQDILIQDWYATLRAFNNELGFFRAGDSDMYFHIPLDNYDVSDIGLNEFGNQLFIEIVHTLASDPELAISLEHTSNTLLDAFNRVCIKLDNEED